MLIARVNDATRGDDRVRGEAIVTSLMADPLTPHLAGTVVIGASGVGIVGEGDPAPRVLVVLDEYEAEDALARANARRADAIVTLGNRARRAMAGAIASGIPIIAVDDRRETPRAFLVGTTDTERARAWEVIRHHKALADALAVAAPQAVPPAGGMRRVVEAIQEAVVVASRGYTPHMERPAG